MSETTTERPARHRKVLRELAVMRDDEGIEWVTAKRLADRLGCSSYETGKALGRLCADGAVEPWNENPRASGGTWHLAGGGENA